MWTIVALDQSGKEVARSELGDAPVTVGRGKDCVLVLPSGAVSRKHARIELRGGKPFLLDEGSANGTMVNGKKVVAPAELVAGSSIEITPFRLRVEGPPGEEDDDGERTVMIRSPAAAPLRPPPPPAAPPGGISISSRPPPPPVWTPPPEPKPAPPAPRPVADEPRFLDVPSGGPGAAAGKPARSPADSDWDSAASELDRQIQSVRSYREQTADITQTRVQQLDADWSKLVANLQTVKQRLSGNPRLLVFNFSREMDEVTIKIEDKRQRLGYRYFLISRHHPENKFPGKDSVWLRETGREDMDFRDAKAAQSELLQRVAATLA